MTQQHTVTTSRRLRRARRAVGVTLATGTVVLGLTATASAFVAPGTPAKDVTVGLDNDNANNPIIQPAGVAAKQHMENTDVLFGRANDDLLVGRQGSDTLLGGSGSDIMVGGPEKFAAPNSDVMVGDTGDDISIWAPGDGSDAFIGNGGNDTMIFAPFVEKTDGSLLLTRYAGRRVPRVAIDDQPAFSCTIVEVPASERLGAQFLIRFNVNAKPVATVRQSDIETVYCPSPLPGRAQVARLTAAHHAFSNVWLRNIGGTTGKILSPVR